MVAEIKTASEFRDAVAKGLVVVDFFATWCGPCKMISPVLEKLDPKYPEIKFVKVDVEEVQEIAQEYGITAMPTFLYFKDGKVEYTVRGANPPAIKDNLEKLQS